MMNSSPVLTSDLGGTKMVVALVSPEGQVIDRHRQPTLAKEGPYTVIDRLFSSIDYILDRNNILPRQLQAMSLGIAGIIDTRNGIVDKAPNLPGWENLKLKDKIYDRYTVPVHILNETDASTLGEHRYGAGKGLKNIALITIGTGIGGGLVLDGRLFLGSSGSAFEIGHMVVKDDGPECGCGKNGCLETLVSGTAIGREARKRVAEGEKSMLIDMVDGVIETITAEKVHKAAKQGDLLALRILADASYYLGLGIINLVTIINPEMIIVGGSVARIGNLLLDPVRQMVKDKTFALMVKKLKIVKARLGEDAGLIGAAAYALDKK
ncbi:MAG: ROK family protein [Dehalococcoidales bacterium]|nr:MAG: ROK family protein [Dehalococcoidales bacterium]